MIRFKRNGFALVTLLWVMALIGVIASAALFTTRTDARLTTLHISSAKARALAEAGVFKGIHSLTVPSDKVSLGLPDPVPTLYLGGGSVDVEIENEAGKIDINHADTELIQAAIQSSGASDILQNNILQSLNIPPDTLDGPDNAAIKQQERKRYDTIDELIGSAYPQKPAYRYLRKAFTVHSELDTINPNVATPEALSGIPGLSKNQIKAWISRRENTFIELSRSSDEKQHLSSKLSSIYTITSTARVQNAIASVISVVKMYSLRERPYTILSWTEST